MQSTESHVKQATELLRQDLRNAPLHCFGIHTNYSTGYCKVAHSTLSPTTADTHVPTTTDTHEPTTADIHTPTTAHTPEEDSTSSPEEEPVTLGLVAAVESLFWHDVTDAKELEAVHFVAPQLPSNVDQIWYMVSGTSKAWLIA